MRKTAIVWVVFVSLLVVSCANQNLPLQPQDITLSPVLTPTATLVIPTLCAEVTPVLAPIVRPKTIYVLIDKSGSFEQWRKDAISTLFQSMENVLQPGDYIYMGWIGVESSDPRALFFSGEVEQTQELVFLPYPDYLSDPSSLPLPPQPAGTLTSIQILNATATTDAYSTQIAGTETAVTQNMQDVLCQGQGVHIENLKRLANFESQRKAAVKNFIEQRVQPALEEAEKTPYDSQTLIYDALYIASRILQNDMSKDIDKPRDYELLILSDMVDTGSRTRHSLRMNFSNVEITIAMVYCPSAINCENVEDDWGEHLRKEAYAKDVTILIVQETTVDQLIYYLTTHD